MKSSPGQTTMAVPVAMDLSASNTVKVGTVTLYTVVPEPVPISISFQFQSSDPGAEPLYKRITLFADGCAKQPKPVSISIKIVNLVFILDVLFGDG